MIRRREKHLRDTFHGIVLLALAGPAALQACGSSSSGSSSGGDAGGDATTSPTGDGASTEAAPGEDGSGGMDVVSADARMTGDAGLDAAACDPTPTAPPYLTDASFVTPDGGDASSECYYYVDLPCASSLTTGTGASACYLYLSECARFCPQDAGGFVDCRLIEGAGCADGSAVLDAGAVTLACGLCNGVGRRPAGLRRRGGPRADTALGAYFAEGAHLEAASVTAFERLRDELRALRAPAALIKAAERAIRDEVRHTTATTRIARRFGGAPRSPEVRRGAKTRSLERVALENAVEGCVRETYGALVATWQAARARDPEIRRSMQRIAVDETRHAALAWEVAAWADTRLSAAARARVARARQAAGRTLAKELAQTVPPELVREAGLPDRLRAAQLLSALETALA